jgi:cytohesin
MSWTALHEAVARCDAELVEELLRRGADPNKKDADGMTPFDVALEARCVAAVRLLIDVAKPTEKTLLATRGYMPLLAAVIDRWPWLVEKYGGAALIRFAAESPEAVALLLGFGVGPNTADARGMTPLHYAAAHCRADVAQLLVQHGADVNAKIRRGSTPLHIAASGGCAEVAELLLKHGANPNARDSDGRTPLHYAVLSGDLKTVRLLLDAGGDPNVANVRGMTPLHYAAVRCHAEIARLLLSRGADPALRTCRGELPELMIAGLTPECLDTGEAMRRVRQSAEAPPGGRRPRLWERLRRWLRCRLAG